ncbi:MAG: ABC transporter transmembrane domain-containing protein, partial [Defluviitaleaceae bacterium]|nr:ABC transporter transmembrane domain-containing protein [Defluviitaleaceae bacterium]
MNHFEEQDYNKSFDWSLWKKLWRFCKNYKKEFVLLIISSALLGVISAIFPQLTGYAIDNFVLAQDLSNLPAFIGVYVAAVFVQGGIVFAFIYISGKIEFGISHDVRQAAFERLQRLSYSYFDNTPVGWMMARLTSDTVRIGEIISWGTVDIAYSIAMMFFYLIFMFFTN